MSGPGMPGVKAAHGTLSMRNSHYQAKPKNMMNIWYLGNEFIWKKHVTRMPLYFICAYAWTNFFDPRMELLAEYNQGYDFCQRKMWDAVEARTKKRLAEAGDE